MLYVERNERGDIVAISQGNKDSTAERKEAVDEEILAFLREHASADSSLHTLIALDLKTIRIIDDMVELLIRKNLIMFSELPPAAQKNLIARKRLRASIQDSATILDDTEIL